MQRILLWVARFLNVYFNIIEITIIKTTAKRKITILLLIALTIAQSTLIPLFVEHNFTVEYDLTKAE